MKILCEQLREIHIHSLLKAKPRSSYTPQTISRFTLRAWAGCALNWSEINLKWKLTYINVVWELPLFKFEIIVMGSSTVIDIFNSIHFVKPPSHVDLCLSSQRVRGPTDLYKVKTGASKNLFDVIFWWMMPMVCFQMIHWRYFVRWVYSWKVHGYASAVLVFPQPCLNKALFKNSTLLSIYCHHAYKLHFILKGYICLGSHLRHSVFHLYLM